MKKILLVDDNELNRDMLSRRLTRAGYLIDLAGDGREATEMVATLKPDIILLDMSLPIMSGWQAAAKIKAEPETRNIPIIGLSAHASSEDRQRALDMGCDDYETKPVDFERLVLKIESLIN